MNRQGNLILKLLGDRVLFIVASFIFLIPLTSMMTWLFPWNRETMVWVYTIFAGIPYLSILYLDMWLYGKWEKHEPNVPHMLRKLAINESGVVLMLMLMAILGNMQHVLGAFLSKAAYIIVTGPFSAAQLLMLMAEVNYTLPWFWWIAPLVLEIAVALIGYFLGRRECIPMNYVRKKLGLSLIDRK